MRLNTSAALVLATAPPPPAATAAAVARARDDDVTFSRAMAEARRALSEEVGDFSV
jgi:hypothetical protein